MGTLSEREIQLEARVAALEGVIKYLLVRPLGRQNLPPAQALMAPYYGHAQSVFRAGEIKLHDAGSGVSEEQIRDIATRANRFAAEVFQKAEDEAKKPE